MEVLIITKEKNFKVEKLNADIFPIGENMAFIRFRSINDKDVELVQIFVNKNHRVEGYGRKIIEKFQKISKDKGFERIIVNSGALKSSGFGKFLVKMGYKHVRETVWFKRL
jgi:histone acetyltransferase (RNA polymerase elongator complex component)